MVILLEVKKAFNQFNRFCLHNSRCKLFSPPKISKPVGNYWKIQMFSAGGKPVAEETWACFSGCVTSELVTLPFIPPWNSEASLCDESSGNFPGVRKESMKRKQKWSQPLTSPGWQLTFANKKSKNPSSDSLMTKSSVYPSSSSSRSTGTGSTDRLVNSLSKKIISRQGEKRAESGQGCKKMCVLEINAQKDRNR